MTTLYVRSLTEVDERQIALVGGKGANLGALSRMDGVVVPAGFCVTTEAYQRMLAAVPSIAEQWDQLSGLSPDDRAAIGAVSAKMRDLLMGTALPDDVAAAVTEALLGLGKQGSYAVRSSATAEDLPRASFAGQHDSFLQVEGVPAVLQHVRRCWASLFSERAVAYRLRNGIDSRSVRMAVVVQQMVDADAAGVLFTADPVSGHRRVAVVEATVGLGEALVSGLVDPDRYRVRDDAVLSAEKGARDRPTLTEEQVRRLVRLGRRIEARVGQPQDIEWCLADDAFQILQARPITTLFPVPPAADQEFHVYVSVGHQQMMTDPMKPLGLSFWQLTTPAPMAEAGGRLFVDVTRILAAPASRTAFLALMGKSDPLMADALTTVIERGDVTAAADGEPPRVVGATPARIDVDPDVVPQLMARTEASIAAAAQEISGRSGEALLEFIRTDLQELRRLLFDPVGHQVFMSAMEASWWLDEHLATWLGEQNAADILTRSVPHNVTSEMGLALLDVADAIRPHAEVVAFLQQVEDDDFLDQLPRLVGGGESRAAIEGWLDRYGMRCVGEIDLTRPRWRERPSTLLPLILGNAQNSEPGSAKQRFTQGRREAHDKEQELLERLRARPDGESKAEETRQRIYRVRTFIGYREYPKYGMVSRYFVYKQALLAEAERLVEAGALREQEDIFFLSFAELEDVVRSQRVDNDLVNRRKEVFRTHQALAPPRVLTSDGEAVPGAYRRDDVPAGALVGLAVSAGTVEGRARVVSDLALATFEPGDILVTTHTDPSWTPAFVAVAGLVAEVGGQMTHGAVIAREYGLPAVVGVVDATRRIADGQRIRVHGTAGYVELLS